MVDLLFECFSEEIPARMQAAAAEQLESKLVAALKDANLAHGEVRSFVSPRHLAVMVKDLPAQQPDQTTERKGPKTNAPQPAIDGFLKSTGLTLDQLQIQTIGKDECYMAVVHSKGKALADAIKPMLEDILRGFHWPKSQRWGAYDIAWVRPLQAMVCLLDGAVVPVQFGHLTASNITYGHRFLAPQPISLADPSLYVRKLEDASVLVNHEQREGFIESKLQEVAAKHGLTVVKDDALLSEVTGLVEWPVVVCGEFDTSYLKLPPEVLISEMRHHQKYFALQSADGTLSNRFLVVTNMVTDDDAASVIKGNQRVLRARLEDGQFFWNQDRNKPLSSWLEDTRGMIFHAKLGSVYDKAQRIESLAATIASMIGADVEKTKRAAQLCKADLVTGMVGEFPDLQGVMGRYYALEQKEDTTVADAIRDHYKPAGANDSVPTAPISVAVAMADKLDSLVGLFAVGEKPTGSKDPFALRRAALGILRMILENGLRVNLPELVEHVYNILSIKGMLTADIESRVAKHHAVEEVQMFFADRLKVMLRDAAIRHDVVAAVMSSADSDVLRVANKARAIEAFANSDDGANLLAAYRRACNILEAEEKKDKTSFNTAPQPAHFQQDEERTLFDALQRVEAPVSAALAAEHYESAMRELASLRKPLDAYFDKVMVNAPESAVRINRLNTLNQIRACMNQVADFGLIEIKTESRELKAA